MKKESEMFKGLGGEFERLVDFDLTLEMTQYSVLDEYLRETCLECGVSYEEIFGNEDEHFLERYMLYRVAEKDGKLGRFDCDHHRAKGVSNISDEFFAVKFGVDKERNKDSAFSLQSIWGRPWPLNGLGVIPKVFGTERGKDFKWQLRNIELIKEKLGTELYEAFDTYAHYYHTIGNMMPCPAGDLKYKGHSYNQAKGLFCSDDKYQFDRFDAFYRYLKERRDEAGNEAEHEWFDEINELVEDERYALKEFVEFDMKLVIPEKGEIRNNAELANYLNVVADMMKRRGEKLVRA